MASLSDRADHQGARDLLDQVSINRWQEVFSELPAGEPLRQTGLDFIAQLDRTPVAERDDLMVAFANEWGEQLRQAYPTLVAGLARARQKLAANVGPVDQFWAS